MSQGHGHAATRITPGLSTRAVSSYQVSAP